MWCHQTETGKEMHTTGSGEPREPPPTNHWKSSMLLWAALPRRRERTRPGQQGRCWNHSIHPVAERPHSYSWHSQKVLKKLSFRSQNNFILQMRKLRPVASERFALGCMAELGSLRFAQPETNSEATQGETVKWEDSSQMATPHRSAADTGLANYSKGTLVKDMAPGVTRSSLWVCILVCESQPVNVTCERRGSCSLLLPSGFLSS